MKKIFALILTIICINSVYSQCTTLFFSEYIEGSSSNKAIEIYNPTSVAIDLDSFAVARFNNGGTAASNTQNFPAGTIIAAGGVYVIGNSSANAAILAESDTTSGLPFFNGDDAVILYNNVTLDTLDAIGEIGVDPGAGWTVGTGATNNFTLVRKNNITQGTKDWSVGITQWDVFPIDITDSLGAHSIIPCAPPCAVSNSSFSVTECITYTVPSGDETYNTPGTNTVADTISNHCGSDSIMAITVTILPIKTGNDNSTICSTGSIVINGNTYDATTSTGTEVFTNVGPNNCDSTVTIALNVLPALSGNNNTTICATGSIVINGNTYDATTSTGTEVFTNVGPNNCDSTVTIVLNVLPALTGNNNTTICATENIVINGNTYDATTSTGTEVFLNVGPNNCDSTVAVALNILPALTGNNNTTICATESIVVNGNTYDATTSTGTEVFTNVGPNNCDSTVTIALNVLAAIDVSTTNTSPTLTANQAGATYQWLDCDNGSAIILNETGISFTATANGNYAVEITNGSCVDTSACINLSTVGINENAASNSVNIYPNPNNGIFTLNVKANNASVEVMNTQGQVILTKNIINNKQQIDLSDNAKGIYFITVTSENGVSTHKVSVQ